MGIRNHMFVRAQGWKLYDYSGEKGIMGRARDDRIITSVRKDTCERCGQGRRVWQFCKSCEADRIADEQDWICPDCAGSLLPKYQFADFDANDATQYLLVCLPCWRVRARIQNSFIRVLRSSSPTEKDLKQFSKSYAEADEKLLWIVRSGKIGVLWQNGRILSPKV